MMYLNIYPVERSTLTIHQRAVTNLVLVLDTWQGDVRAACDEVREKYPWETFDLAVKLTGRPL
jgi:hypothetical protein